jgi:hypothetical protein
MTGRAGAASVFARGRVAHARAFDAPLARRAAHAGAAIARVEHDRPAEHHGDGHFPSAHHRHVARARGQHLFAHQRVDPDDQCLAGARVGQQQPQALLAVQRGAGRLGADARAEEGAAIVFDHEAQLRGVQPGLELHPHQQRSADHRLGTAVTPGEQGDEDDCGNPHRALSVPSVVARGDGVVPT